MDIILSDKDFDDYTAYLKDEEKSENTIQKYARDIRKFISFIGKEHVTKQKVIAYKESLINASYAPASINSMLAAVNDFLIFKGLDSFRVKYLKLQKEVFYPESKELTREEYRRLKHIAAIHHNRRLCMILETICSTGIRVSELKYITVESVQQGSASVDCKGKTRKVLMVKSLLKKLRIYIRDMHIRTGPVFVTRNGKPVSRTNIWKELKKLCKEAEVASTKVFPHNLRHLFARVFYETEKDIAKLADILGHSSISTTRIYIRTSYEEHLSIMEKMCLVE